VCDMRHQSSCSRRTVMATANSRADILNLEDYHMHLAHRYITSLFLTAALAFKSESTIGSTRIITTGMTTKIAPGGSTSTKTTRIHVNSRRQTKGSSLITGIGATLIQIIISKVTTSDEVTYGNKEHVPPVTLRTGRRTGVTRTNAFVCLTP
jgi:hypothetical protein